MHAMLGDQLRGNPTKPTLSQLLQNVLLAVRIHVLSHYIKKEAAHYTESRWQYRN
jgi:hypothetical protein